MTVDEKALSISMTTEEVTMPTPRSLSPDTAMSTPSLNTSISLSSASSGPDDECKPSPSTNVIKRDEEFWFEDGTITLVIENTEFRMYKGLLFNRFPVFKDMLACAQPAAASERPEDVERTACPVLYLTGDSARDWRNVFRMFMPREDDSFFKQPPHLSPESVFACIRLGHKYRLANVCRHALDYLKSHFTHSFDRWEKIPVWSPDGFEEHHAIGVVNIARLTGETSLLPTGLWLCSMLGSAVLEGFTYSDGTKETLSPEDVALCIQAQQKLSQDVFLGVVACFSPPLTQSCKHMTSPNPCQCATLDMLPVVQKVVERSMYPNPLWEQSRAGWRTALAGLCEGCVDTVFERRKQQRRSAWRKLPSVFGLDIPGWG